MKKIIVVIASIVLISANAQAQNLVNSELQNILNQSLVYFPKVKEVQQTVQLSEEKLALTKLNAYPDINFDASYAYVQPRIEVAFGDKMFQFAPEHNYGAAINGVYTLMDFGRLKANIERSKMELQTSKHVAAQLKESLFYQVTQLYFQIIYAKKAIEIQNTVLAVLNENKKLIETQLKNGNAIQLDLLTIQSKIDNENNRKIDVETNLKKLTNLLTYATGVDKVKESDLSFTLKNYTTEEALQLAIMNNPSLAIAKDKVNVAKAELEVSKLNSKPYVGLKASVGSKNGGVGLSVPLFNGGKIKQAVKIHEQGLAIQETSATALVHDFEKDINAAIIDIESNQNRIKNAATQIEQAALAQKLSNAKLLNGTVTPVELTSTNSDYQRALLNQLQYQYQLCNAKLELAKLMGLELVH
jgi:outer membrane protein TolC